MNNPFISQITPPTNLTEPSLWLIWHNEELLLQTSSNLLSIPKLADLSFLTPHIDQQLYLGTYDATHCFTASLSKKPDLLSPDLIFQPIRQSHETLNNQALFNLVTRARQLINWDKITQFCGRCGQRNSLSTQELAKICTVCQALTFPQITPAMLVLVWRKDEILLARSSHFLPGVYSILAGFVEVGETLEETVRREVMEEVGIKIKNLTYFNSQSWPFPSNLMLGFMAEYESGELKIDSKELEDARWFPLTKLPQLPKPISLSRQMIESHLSWWKEQE